MPRGAVAVVRRQALGDLLRRSARRVPGKLAVGDGRTSCTYAELDADANRVANALAARGIGPGDRVALLSRNSSSFVQAIFGVARLGAVLVPVNFMFGAEEVGYVLGHSKAVAVLVQDALVPVAEGAIAVARADELRARVVLGEASFGSRGRRNTPG